MVSARLTHANGNRVDTKLLVDSGADYSMVQRSLVGGMLGVDVDRLPRDDTFSVSGQMEVGIVDLDVTLEQSGRKETFRAPFQVPINCPGFPGLPLLGREPLFHVFDVSFRQDYTTSIGKFTLRKVTRRRSPAPYRVGGRPLP